MKVYILTKQDIERMLEENSYPKNTVMIEIYDFLDERSDDDHAFHDKLLKIDGDMSCLPLYDIDIDELPEYGLTEDTYWRNPDREASFIKRAYRQNYDIVCFSETGTSRSSACAAAILEYYYGNGMSVFKDSRYNPNKLVYNNLLKALRDEEKIYMHVDIYSRKAVEALLEKGFPENTAVISFYDPPNIRTGAVTKPVDYQGKAERVFYIPIYDIDIEVLPDFGLTYDTYFPEVDRLAEFIMQACADDLNIICQCEYGQSRSAACAAAILEYFFSRGISVFADYRYYPNQLIYNKIKNALEKTVNSEGRVCRFKGDCRFLSNFYQYPFEFKGMVYTTAQTAFETQKYFYDEYKSKCALQKSGDANAPTNWDDISYDIMNEILHAKFAVPELAEKLKATGDDDLEEHNRCHDNRWGKCTCKKCSAQEGQNWLGKILMGIREELNRNA